MKTTNHKGYDTQSNAHLAVDPITPSKKKESRKILQAYYGEINWALEMVEPTKKEEEKEDSTSSKKKKEKKDDSTVPKKKENRKILQAYYGEINWALDEDPIEPTKKEDSTVCPTTKPPRPSSKPINIHKMKKESSQESSSSIHPSSLPNTSSLKGHHKVASHEQQMNSDHHTTTGVNTEKNHRSTTTSTTNKNIKHEKSNTYSGDSNPQPVDSRSRAKSFQQSTQKATPLTNESSKRSKPLPTMTDEKELLDSYLRRNSKIEEDNKQSPVTPTLSSTPPTSSPKDQKITSPRQKKLQQQLKNTQLSTSAPSSCLHPSISKEQETLDEVLDELCMRFIINCPYMHDYGTSGFERLFFQLEEAFWFYSDFFRQQSLPKFKFVEFCEKMLARHPHLLIDLQRFTRDVFPNADNSIDLNVDTLVQKFLDYKTSVPVYGCVLLNEAMDKVLLVQGYNTKSWSFPKGKINQFERESHCAAREVYEECGYDLRDKICESDYIELEQNYENSLPKHKDQYKHSNPYTKLFIVSGIPESTNFVTRTRKEILKIQWFSIDYLVGTCNAKQSTLRTWLVKPFLSKIKEWIKKKKVTPSGSNTPTKNQARQRSLTAPAISIPTENMKKGTETNGASPLLSFVFNTEEIVENCQQ
ncbi:hypothetical protein C9374_005519 [Naegleria lovaniensis]|uniref:Nudix hydrolase domain-containing protein n=1 Tax=Naegleria lovaniensis TaxID=51637 RepID=A0AA88GPW5_NAELO|nr:uncharacterized protein C9374_005519 [Naegleria lovaniensis]KAG2382317.1 hypothetical protein C9374_005519 [Naegleria lovaniensis]